MTKHMLIDASHPEETRVAVVDGNRIEELDFEIAAKRQLRGNIYLAKVVRVEPSLQAAFVEYGGNRHGFLAFNEIHPDYFQIPHADREALLREAAEDEAEIDGADDEEAELERRRNRMLRKYKIQDVVRRRQILLVQVVKEERGNKGAALTTYLSLAGRYCVLMPNTARGGGISRKITNAVDRKRLKSAVGALEVPTGMGLIIRTAGAARTKAEIKRDYDYLLRLWETIRVGTLKSVAPTLIYAEEDLVKRAVRDMFDKDFESVQVEGYDGYKEARDFMRMLMPSQSAKVHHYTDGMPLFARFGVEDKIAQIHSPVVPLRSGGYLVINQTEALVAIDVNSGKATRERNIEQTALKTNLEAAEEAARQLRLRDLAGLIVIDFIDMDESKNDKAVEKVLKDCLRDDRARVQMGRISQFGLMEISRQRRRMGVLEGATHVCPHCHGVGRVRSVESSALGALRAVEMEAVKGGAGSVILSVCSEVGLYVLNDKREFLQRTADAHGLHVVVRLDDALAAGEQTLERTETRHEEFSRPAVARVQAVEMAPESDFADLSDEVEDEDEAAEVGAPRHAVASAPRDEEDGEGRSGRGRRRRRRGGRDRGDRPEPRDGFAADAPQGVAVSSEDEEDGEQVDGAAVDGGDGARSFDANDEAGHRRRRRRGRRGGRRMREGEEGAAPADAYGWTAPAEASPTDPYAWTDPLDGPVRPPAFAPPQPAMVAAEAQPEPAPAASEPEPGPQVAAAPGEEPYGWEAGDAAAAAVAAAPAGALPFEEPAAEKPRRGRRPRRGAPAADAGPPVEAEHQPAAEPDATPPPPQPQPELASVAAEAEPAEPDPSEITSPPVQPRRGWWNRLRGG